MAYRVVFRPQAIRDLNSIAEYIARHNRPRAVTFAEEIEAVCRDLRFFPLKGRAHADPRSGFRLLPYRRRVLIAYRIEGERIRIMNIFYAGQDYETVLRKESGVE
jgi:toxin ParE1/3/4